MKSLVGVRGFEPPAPASRRQCSTKLSYTPTECRGSTAKTRALQGEYRPYAGFERRLCRAEMRRSRCLARSRHWCARHNDNEDIRTSFASRLLKNAGIDAVSST